MNPNTKFDYETTGELAQMLERADALREAIESRKPIEGDLWKTIEQKLLVEWTYNTNAIEGSTLTQGETLFFLQSGLTVEGKPFKDFLDAKNHAQAVGFLYDLVTQKRVITPGVIKEINALLLTGVTSTAALDSFGNRFDKPATPGQYKTQPNHVLQSDGSIHKYVEPVHVAQEIEQLCRWCTTESQGANPLVVAALAHYHFVRIHPFDDGNGRGARLLMNLILMQAGYPPAIIKNELRRKYITTLSQADGGDFTPFIQFVTESALETMEAVNEILGNTSTT